MPLVDWRELYAANRAVIEGRRPPMPGLPTSALARPRGRRAPRASSDVGETRREPRGERSGALFVYTPPGSPPATAAPLVVMLHGCTQTPATFAAGAGMNTLADRHRFVVLYPEQTRAANRLGCWNWFLPAHQARDSGEPARIAQATRAMIADRSTWAIDPQRVYVAGMSAGGAMAAVMAASYPDLFAALAVHSGVAYRRATTLRDAYRAMAGGAHSPVALGEAVVGAMGGFARPVPTMVVHGTADRTVSPINGDQVLEQWMVANRLLCAGECDADPRRPSTTAHGRADGGQAYVRSRWTDRRGTLQHEYTRVEGLGHAWSGGAPGGSYTDPRGPSASEAMWDFFRAVAR
jgi:poly(hydroxyalkanoate) depolymerase family esterase